MPMSQAILWILLSTLFVSGTGLMTRLYYLSLKERRLNDDQYRIVALVQTTPDAEALKSVYLAEWLSLSFDRPTNLYRFNVKEGEQILLDHLLIKKVTIKKIFPGTLHIDYQRRKPLAYIGDFANSVIDDEGYLFPFRPFFKPTRLPTLYLGLEKGNWHWGNCLKALPSVELALHLLYQFEQLPQDQWSLKQLDVAQAEAESYGQRQVVLVIEKKKPREDSSKEMVFLRLNPDHLVQDLSHFCTLNSALFETKERDFLEKPAVIIDLRVAHLALIKEG